MQGSLTLPASGIGVSCVWTVKEKINGLYVPVLQKKNLLTNYGLTALASAYTGWTPPQYLCIDSFYVLFNVQANPGDTSVTLSAAVDLAGDTQLVLSPGLASQEVVTFTSRTIVSGVGTVYTLSSPVVNTHLMNDPVARQVTLADTVASVISEMTVDNTNFPGQRFLFTSSFSAGVGNNVVQFYLQPGQGVGMMMTVGLADSPLIGQGNIHNRVVLGYNHTTANDIEIDANITIANM